MFCVVVCIAYFSVLNYSNVSFLGLIISDGDEIKDKDKEALFNVAF